MRVLLSTYGSRGDVEPVVGLGAALQALGVEVPLCAPPDQEFRELLARADVPLTPAYTPMRQLVADMGKRFRDIRELAAEVVVAQYDAISAAAEGCDVVLASGLFPSAAATRSVAERMAVPYVCAIPCPIFLPSHHHRPLAYPGCPVPPDVTDHRALWDWNVRVMNLLFGEAYNAHRASIGLAVVDNVRDHVFTDRPWLASDPILSPWLPTELYDVVQTGAWILPDPRPLAAEIEAFLEAGPSPVYVGFGSMTMEHAPDAARTAIKAVRAQGRRMLLARGWAELAAIDDQDDCLVVGEVNQQALFRRVAAVVHHGGAGTTTVAAQAGASQLIVPQVWDQPYWAGRVAELGVGVAHDGPVPTFESLSAGLQAALAPQTSEKAAAVASTIRTDGAMVTAKMLIDMIRGERR
ncbi:MAG: glycosyltransferase family 1 protein [Acetobacteraceae bacterium]|nr:glycosyltransferase family 1 protein [Acetobacteraceae bacterium]